MSAIGTLHRSSLMHFAFARPDIDGRRIASTLEAIQTAERLADRFDKLARDEDAQRADERAVLGRRIVRDQLAAMLPGVDLRELGRVIGA